MNAGSGTIQGTARSPYGFGGCEWECVRGVRVRSQHYQPHSITAHHTTYSHGRWFCRYYSFSIFPPYLALSLSQNSPSPSPLTDFMIVELIFYYLFSFIFAGLLQSFIICPVGKQSPFSSLFLLLLSSSFFPSSFFLFFSCILLLIYFLVLDVVKNKMQIGHHASTSEAISQVCGDIKKRDENNIKGGKKRRRERRRKEKEKTRGTTKKQN